MHFTTHEYGIAKNVFVKQQLSMTAARTLYSGSTSVTKPS